MRFEITEPVETVLERRRVTVRGWCLDASGDGLRGMRALANGREFKARRKLPSLALMEEFPGNEEAAFAGFEIDVEVSGGRSRIRLEVKVKSGKWEEIGTIDVRAPRFRADRERDGFDYEAWSRSGWNALGKREVGEIRRRGNALQSKARFSVVADDPAGAGKMMAGQIYDRWQVVAPGSRVGEGFVVFLGKGEALSPDALFLMAEELDRYDGIDLVYGDEDREEEKGSGRVPIFKPDFDLDLLGETDYVTRSGAFRAEMFQGLPATRDRAFGAVAGMAADRVRHVPRVLYHGTGPLSAPRSIAPDVPEPGPKVAIVIPTRDRLPLLRTCIESIRSHTDYRNYEVVVVDNGSEEEETKAYLREFRGTVIDAPGPFNYAGLNNRAVKEVDWADLVVLLNNDIEVPSSSRGWLGALVECAARPGVGAVGAHLYYPDGKIQHAGVFLGFRDAAGHLYHGMAPDGPDLMRRRGFTHGISAVTGACLAVSRGDYLDVGGMDEKVFAVNYNDVDLCLKLAAAGGRNLITPHAELIHHESASRGDGATDGQKARAKAEMVELYKRWGEQIARDPYYNENLTLHREDGSLATRPRWSAPRKR